jgi:hypothetical protein
LAGQRPPVECHDEYAGGRVFGIGGCQIGRRLDVDAREQILDVAVMRSVANCSGPTWQSSSATALRSPLNPLGCERG